MEPKKQKSNEVKQKTHKKTKSRNAHKTGPVKKSVESELRPKASIWWERVDIIDSLTNVQAVETSNFSGFTVSVWPATLVLTLYYISASD